MQAIVAKLLVVLGLAALVGACNTVEGAGKDISAGGEAITKGADNVQKKI